MTFRLRIATEADIPELVPRSSALQRHENIDVSDAELERALREFLADPRLGVVFMIEEDSVVVGYTFLSYSYDLEFAGREAWLTEIFIDEAARGRGGGSHALSLLEPELRARGVRAYHLQVRSDNPAKRLYERAGMTVVPRLIMSKRL
jgi:ribosomal protein S18 acetylase RimI-like enzyme